MWRASPRRIVIYVVTFLSGIILLVNIQQTFRYQSFNMINQIDEDVENETMSDDFVDKTKDDGEEKVKDPVISPTPLPWYMANGMVRPSSEHTGDLHIFPEDGPGEDRITDQLMYVPSDYHTEHDKDPSTPLKKVLMWNGLSSWGGVRAGRGEFLKQDCPVSTCALVTDKTHAEEADLVIFKDHFSKPSFKRPASQLWMIYMLECPLHTQVFPQRGLFNWTGTYRGDSTIVTPYERWEYYDKSVQTRIQDTNYAANKTGHVAWFVSNCGARNGRLEYARELAKYIPVDIYGACGNKSCPRSSPLCNEMLNNHYKFYLAFENSNCRDYITEKFYVTGLGHNVLPIVMGARPEDYARVAPYHSYIHVDQFRGPRHLAEYLHMLDKDHHKYNEYFKWKGTGEFINTRFFCRVCSLLHYDKARSVTHYQDVNTWWRGEGVCSNKEGWGRGG